MSGGPADTDRINQFALVSYIPGALGEFLDRLRKELVAGCKPHAHVTVLPPRMLETDVTSNLRTIEERLDGFSPFEVELTGIEIFEKSDVIYVALDRGRDELEALYKALNTSGLYFRERFSYHPHVTLAQDMDPDKVPEVLELAKRRWQSVPAKSFRVDTLTFVQNTCNNNWIDLMSYDLAAQRVRR